MAADKPRKKFAIVRQGSIFDGIAYWVILAGVYIMVGGLMFYSGKGKLFGDDGNAPAGIKEQFKGTFIDTPSRGLMAHGSSSAFSSSASSS